jgi:hypothetical protein
MKMRRAEFNLYRGFYSRNPFAVNIGIFLYGFSISKSLPQETIKSEECSKAKARNLLSFGSLQSSTTIFTFTN